MSKNRNKGMDFYSDNFFQSDAWNRRSFVLYRDWLLSLAICRYKWVNLPETCDSRALEWFLLTRGVATIAAQKDMPDTFYSTQALLQSPPNVYNNPTVWESFGNNGWRFNVTPANGVLVWDNTLRQPIIDKLDLFARRLSFFDRVEDVNLRQQFTPMLLLADQTQKNDLIQVYKQIVGGEPAILGTKAFNDIEIKAIETAVPYMGEQLKTGKMNLWNDAYTFLGIDNLPKKSERMIVGEVDSFTMPTKLRALDGLMARRQACDTLNKRFGLDVDVVWNMDEITKNYQLLNDLQMQANMGMQTDIENGGEIPCQ